MSKESTIPPRLELFSDAVFAIIITIMVLEMRPPEGSSFKDLYLLWPLFFAYVLSFLNLYINWQNHHHLLRLMSRPTGKIMLANGHLLFWASLIPFSTAWFGQNLGEKAPTFVYTLVFLLYGLAYNILQRQILAEAGKKSPVSKAVRKGGKDRLTLIAQLLAVTISFFAPWISVAIIFLVGAFWFYPDPIIEEHIIKNDKP